MKSSKAQLSEMVQLGGFVLNLLKMVRFLENQIEKNKVLLKSGKIFQFFFLLQDIIFLKQFRRLLVQE